MKTPPPHQDQSLTRTHADLRLTRLLVACERFRLAHGGIPGSVDELIPEFLGVPLICPLSEQPLSIETLADDSIELSAPGVDPSDPISLSFPVK